jgi:pimeloyl-ACP methyl ester carboxylesterase
MSSLLLLPGLMCDQAVWPAQTAGLADLAASQVVDYGGCDSLAGMAEIALALAPPRFALAAHSMGGRVALEVVRRAPERVTALALLDSGYQPRPKGAAGEPEKSQRLALLELAENQGMRAMGEQWVQGMVHPDRLGDKPLIEDILRMIARKTPAQFAAQIKALLDRPDGEPVLKTIRCPTLVLCGREDSWSPLARHQQMAALIPSSRLIAIEQCGHMSTMERPEAVTEALRGWLTDAAQQAA